MGLPFAARIRILDLGMGTAKCCDCGRPLPLSDGVALVATGRVFQLCRPCAERPEPAAPPFCAEPAAPARLAALAHRRARPLFVAAVGVALLSLAPNTAEPNPEVPSEVLASDWLLDRPARSVALDIAPRDLPRLHALSLSDSGEWMRWVHPLAGPERALPDSASRRFGADRDGTRPECGRGHCGVDLGHERGLVVHAAADGFVERVVVAPDRKGGNYVKLRHPHGFASFYMHLDRIRPGLRRGDLVQAGEPLGTTGRTGIHHSGPHLHFAVARTTPERDVFVDPEPMLREAELLPAPATLPDGEATDDGADRDGDDGWAADLGL
ncbi:MAG: M23 family metallopeptidase [Deltaproteobacteria bacterium]|nr:MAG: M23 family metallopeptidase [Deltaproteobacteria bacterium]